MTLFVREYSWMWTDLHLSLAECRVYAYIYGLSHGEKKGYDGSKRHLAELLGLNAGAVKRILDTLEEKHLIVCTDGVWRSVATDNTEGVATDNENVVSNNESVATDNSPYNPLNNNITDKKQADMPTDLFEKFFKKFVPEFKNRFTVTWYNFDKRSPAAQQAMWNAVKDEPDGTVDKNPFFFVQDFPDPHPEFLHGDEDEDIVQVRYNGTFKLCSRTTMELFGLEWVMDW